MKSGGRAAPLVRVGVVGMVLLVAAGCGGGSPSAGPSPLPLGVSGAGHTTAPTGETSRAPTSAATLSASVDPDSDAAIVAAAHAYVAALQLVGRSASSAPFDAVSTSDCNCRVAVDGVASFLRERKLHEDIVYHFSQPPKIRARSSTSADVYIHFISDPYHTITDQGSIVATQKPDKGDFLVSFRREGDVWRAFLVSNL